MKITYGDGVEDAFETAVRALRGLIVALLPAGEDVPADGSAGPHDVELVRQDGDALIVKGLDADGWATGDERRVEFTAFDRIHVY